VPSLNIWDVNWSLDVEQCPCDVHFADYLEAEKIAGKAIFHFGTGGHHVLGIRAADAGAGNVVLGITASPPEYSAYISLVTERPEVGRIYKVFFGDIYQLEAKLLPELDMVTLFHLGEFRTERNDAYRALTDAELTGLLLDKLRPGGLMSFYSGSFAFDVAERVVAGLVAKGRLAPAGAFKSLRLYSKP
jgi:hypothetical protein